ncbi:MAG TPA: DinB family protein, partial [Gammaproteobacteria bacterium]|nr:DinB family protein [Gammaproteobacteria bacterium]
MISPETIRELERVQELLHTLIEDLDEDSYRRQFHPDLSALGWHLGHCTYVECYWLHEVVRGDDSITRPLRELYVPPLTPKPERGERIPSPADLLDWSRSLQAFNRDWLNGDGQHWANHELLRDEYLPRFLIQHHSQHYETMLMALTQRALAHPAGHVVREVLQACSPRQDVQEVPGGHYRIGGTAPDAFDNELPQQHVTLNPFAIARHPVSNGEFLAFIEDDGYQRA